jgi:hypothetical protein
MWQTAEDEDVPATGLSHEMPCPRCNHPPHLYLSCGDGCDCEPVGMPGERLTAAGD